MESDFSRIQQLIERPNENLSVELKRWIDPDTKHGIGIIVKASIALRNHGGGYLVIGFDDVTSLPDRENAPKNVKEKFHIDKIQGIISRFASEPFEVMVEFPERQEQAYPVIIIPPGVITPVATKSKLVDNNKTLVNVDTVYVRSLNSNNTPSTTQATWKDWSKIVEVCFDNREADIGRFIRRHLTGLNPEALKQLVSITSQNVEPERALEDRLAQFLQESEMRYEKEISDRHMTLPEHGVWEVALLLVGQIPPHSPNRTFLNLLESSNPNYTGWPVWLASPDYSDKSSRPFVLNGVWESLIVSIGGGWGDNIDYMRFDPGGKFYLRRALEDDLSKSQRAPEPMKGMDYALPILWCAEAITVGLSFAKAMGCDQEKTTLAYAFQWSKLRGRSLMSWTGPGHHFFTMGPAHQDEISTYVTVPLETPLSAIGNYVFNAVRPLFEIFNGYQMKETVVNDLIQGLIKR